MIEILLSILIALVVGALIVHISAKFAGIENATLMKAFVTALIGAISNVIFGWVPIFGIVATVIVVMVLIRLVYMTTWAKAFVAAIVYIVVIVLTNILFSMLFM